MKAPSKKLLHKFIAAGSIGVVVIFFFMFDLQQYVTFENLKESKDSLIMFYEKNLLLTIFLYMVMYMIMAALSLPGAAIMTMAGGALFGLFTGTVAALISSTVGATLAFLTARFLLRDFVQNRFSDRLEKINEGIRRDGAFFLFTLRLVPVFPFFIINVVMGLTPIRTGVFFIVSLTGMIPGAMVYVNAGRQLSQITSPNDIFSSELIFSFVLLGMFPWIAKLFTGFLRKRRNPSK